MDFFRLYFFVSNANEKNIEKCDIEIYGCTLLIQVTHKNTILIAIFPRSNIKKIWVKCHFMIH